MENQQFWRPPRPAPAEPTPLLPSSLDQVHESSDNKVQHGPASARNLSEESSASIQGQAADVPICIPSDADSEVDGIGNRVAEDNNERYLDFSSCLQLDDTLPPIEKILAPCDNMFEMETRGSKDDSRSTTTNIIPRQPVTQDREDQGDVSAGLSTPLATNKAAARSTASYSPLPIQLDHTSPAPVETRARKSDATLNDAEIIRLGEAPTNSDLCTIRRRSPRVSARRSNKRRSLESPGMSVNAVTKSRYTTSRRAISPCALEDGFRRDLDPQSDSGSNSGSDSDGYLDDDESPSSPDVDGGDEPPVKRRRTERCAAGVRSNRAGSACLKSDHIKPSTISRPASATRFGSPPQSQPSIEGEVESATFEEWRGTVKLTTINGVTTFEGQFEGELSLNLLKALFQTWTSTQKTAAPACGEAGRATKIAGSRGKYTSEEDDLIIDLKTKGNLPWPDIHRRFSDRFPGRSQGALQVRYCTQLKDSN